jgi:hypothetical protein
MKSGSSLCSFNRAFEAYLGSPLQSGDKTLWHGENNGSIKKLFLLVESST